MLIGPSLLFAANKISDDQIPPWLSSEDSFYLTGSKGANIESFELNSFLNGTLQDSLEKSINETIPLKAIALLEQAGIQRSFIEASNAVFGWSCYPSYYGSEQIYSPSDNAIEFMPTKTTESLKDNLLWFIEGIKETAIKYPDKNIIVYVVGGYDAPAVNKAYSLVNNSLTPDYIESEFMNALDDLPEDHANVTVLKSQYDNSSDFYRDFYRTDVHWMPSGALKAYNQIGSVLGWETKPTPELIEFDNWKFFGANARWALMDLKESNDAIFDYEYDFSSLAYRDKSTGELNPIQRTDDKYSASSDQETTYGYLTIWNAPDGDIVNSDEDAVGKALLISNSFRTTIKCLIAQEYSLLRTEADFVGDGTTDLKLVNRIAETDPDEIIFLSHPEGYISLKDREPAYFDFTAQ